MNNYVLMDTNSINYAYRVGKTKLLDAYARTVQAEGYYLAVSKTIVQETWAGHYGEEFREYVKNNEIRVLPSPETELKIGSGTIGRSDAGEKTLVEIGTRERLADGKVIYFSDDRYFAADNFGLKKERGLLGAHVRVSAEMLDKSYQLGFIDAHDYLEYKSEYLKIKPIATSERLNVFDPRLEEKADLELKEAARAKDVGKARLQESDKTAPSKAAPPAPSEGQLHVGEKLAPSVDGVGSPGRLQVGADMGATQAHRTGVAASGDAGAVSPRLRADDVQPADQPAPAERAATQSRTMIAPEASAPGQAPAVEPEATARSTSQDAAAASKTALGQQEPAPQTNEKSASLKDDASRIQTPARPVTGAASTGHTDTQAVSDAPHTRSGPPSVESALGSHPAPRSVGMEVAATQSRAPAAPELPARVPAPEVPVEAGAHGVRVGPGVAAKGLGALGVAATAYEAADTAKETARLHREGNATAAEEHITRFGAQSLGGWGGAVAGAGIGSAAGVTSGPGLLVTGAIGGIAGAVAGDKIVDWYREHGINNQRDLQGNAWTFDPAQPGKGWTRRPPDVEAMRMADGAPIHKDDVRADPAVSDYLTYKASVRSAEFALGAPPQNLDPYRLPPNADEQAQNAPFETGRVWLRDPDTMQWQQHISSMLDGKMSVTRLEAASPERAAQLEQQSQAIIAQNASRTPAAMAAQFEAAYAQHGWERHGTALPQAVQHARAHRGVMVASDGHRYERDGNGNWTHNGWLRDTMAAGNIRHELEETYLQQRTPGIRTLAPVSVRPDATQQTEGHRPPAQTNDAPRAPHTQAPQGKPAHDASPQDQALLEKIRNGVGQLDKAAGKPWDDVSERMTGAAYAAAVKHRFSGEDAVGVALNTPSDARAGGTVLHLYRTGHSNPDPTANRTHIEIDKALAQPAQTHLAQAELYRQDNLQQQLATQMQAQQLAQQQASDQSGPRLSRS